MAQAKGHTPSGNMTLGLTATLLAVTDGVPKVLTITPPKHALTSNRQSADSPSLPFGPFDPENDPTLDQGLRRWITEQTSLNPRYVEQLYTFGNRFRDPQELHGGPRVVSVGYMGLLNEDPAHGDHTPIWRDVYDFLPWEDNRARKSSEDRPGNHSGNRPGNRLLNHLTQKLKDWAAHSRAAETRDMRLHRIRLNFGADGTPFDSERVLERYQLLYEAGLVAESLRDYRALNGKTTNLPMDTTFAIQPDSGTTGNSMVLDHRRILASALQRVRGKIKYRPLIFELLPETFTLLHLQQVAEALAGHKLHKQNFRRLVLGEKLVEETDKTFSQGRGRPAALYTFRENVRFERHKAGVGLPRGKS